MFRFRNPFTGDVAWTSVKGRSYRTALDELVIRAVTEPTYNFAVVVRRRYAHCTFCAARAHQQHSAARSICIARLPDAATIGHLR